MAAYESGEGKRDLKISSYYKSDYISWNLLKSFAGATLAFLICLSIYVLYNLEILLQEVYNMDMLVFIKEILIKYLAFVIIYQIFAYIYYSIEYQKSRNSLIAYYKKLNNLIKIYKKA